MRRAAWATATSLCVVAFILLYYQRTPEAKRGETKRVSVSSLSVSASSQSAPPSSSTREAAVEPSADSDTLLQETRTNAIKNPKLAEQLAREHRARYPNSASSDERDALLVAAVSNQGDYERVFIEAVEYYKRHPNGRYTERIARNTRIQPPPQGFFERQAVDGGP